MSCVNGDPGWYPDPGGEPDRYRYWDGSSWSSDSTDDPQRSAPDVLDSHPPSDRPHAARWLILITVAALLASIGALSVRLYDRASEPALPPASETTRPESSDVPTTSPSSASPRAIGCPEGAPDARSPHPADDRVYGGNLSFPRVQAFAPETTETRLSFAYDVVQQVRTVNFDPRWVAQLAVGRLLADGYPRTPQHTAELVTECIVASDLYRPYAPDRRDRESRAITVSGVASWMITSDFLVEQPLPFAGDRVVVVVVPDGADWGVFFGAVPIGNQPLVATLDQTVAGLRVG